MTNTMKTLYQGKEYEWETFSPDELIQLKNDDGKPVFPELGEVA